MVGTRRIAASSHPAARSFPTTAVPIAPDITPTRLNSPMPTPVSRSGSDWETLFTMAVWKSAKPM